MYNGYNMLNVVVKLNGSSSKYFFCVSRGTRQGSVLSPYLAIAGVLCLWPLEC